MNANPWFQVALYLAGLFVILLIGAVLLLDALNYVPALAPAFPTVQRLTADPALAERLDWQVSNTSVELSLAHRPRRVIPTRSRPMRTTRPTICRHSPHSAGCPPINGFAR